MSQTAKQFADGIDLAQYEERGGKLVRRRAAVERIEAMPKTGNVDKPKRDYKAEFLNQIFLARLPEPTLEFRFHSERMWRWDFCYPPVRFPELARPVAIEYQGGTYSKGKSGHSNVKGQERDMEKFSEGSLLGWIVILINAKSVESGQALGWLDRALKGKLGEKL